VPTLSIIQKELVRSSSDTSSYFNEILSKTFRQNKNPDPSTARLLNGNRSLFVH